MKRLPVLSAMLAAILAVGPAWAQSGAGLSADGGVQNFGKEWEVHYSVFNSTFLSAKNAAAIGITRAANRGVATIALRRQEGKGSTPTPARVTGGYRDLIHSHELKFQEVREGEAVYYLAGFQFSHRDLLRFRIQIVPEGVSKPLLLKFQRRLYADDR